MFTAKPLENTNTNQKEMSETLQLLFNSVEAVHSMLNWWGHVAEISPWLCSWQIWLLCLFSTKEVQLALECLFASLTCHWLMPSSWVPLWKKKAVNHLHVLLSHHQATGHTWALGWAKQSPQETSRLLAGFFTWGISVKATYLRNRRIHFHFQHS